MRELEEGIEKADRDRTYEEARDKGRNEGRG